MRVWINRCTVTSASHQAERFQDSMFADAIPAKTERGRLALQERHFVGSRGRRVLLIMVDGHRTLARLAPVMASLGLSNEDLQALTESGFMTWIGAEGIGHSASLAKSSAVRHHPPPHAQRDATGPLPFGVAEGLLICLEETRRLLGELDEPLREAAAEIDDVAAFRRWFEMALVVVSSRLGALAAASLQRTLTCRLDESLFSGVGSTSTAGAIDIVI